MREDTLFKGVIIGFAGVCAIKALKTVRLHKKAVEEHEEILKADTEEK